MCPTQTTACSVLIIQWVLICILTCLQMPPAVLPASNATPQQTPPINSRPPRYLCAVRSGRSVVPKKKIDRLHSVLSPSSSENNGQGALLFIETLRICSRWDTSQYVFTINPFRTPFPFWGQTVLIPSSLPPIVPKRDCSPKRVNHMKWCYLLFVL